MADRVLVPVSSPITCPRHVERSVWISLTNKVVHFATHGLLAGESEAILKGKAEPALVLTPPEDRRERWVAHRL